MNGALLARGELKKCCVPCTPRGCLALVESTGAAQAQTSACVLLGVAVSGAYVVVVGRSKIVGLPAAQLFMWNGATITVCHSRTADLAEQCRRADILIVAVGKKELIKGIQLTISAQGIHARR